MLRHFVATSGPLLLLEVNQRGGSSERRKNDGVTEHQQLPRADLPKARKPTEQQGKPHDQDDPSPVASQAIGW